MRAAAFVMALVCASTPAALHAVTLVPGAVDCSAGDGHCYQRVGILGNPRQFFTWEELSAFASAQAHEGKVGHLLTLETQAEFDSPLVPRVGYLGALGRSNVDYAWAVGPATGTPVEFFAPLVPGPTPGVEGYCSPFVRLCFSGGSYMAAGPRAQLPPFLTGCPCEQQFVVEYEPDLLAPDAAVLYPNGAETLHVDETHVLQWQVADRFGSLAGVDVLISRAGPDGPFETLAANLPNTGYLAWLVSGPETADRAYLRIVARDAAGNAGADQSDAAFTIAASVPTVASSWGRLKARYR